MRVFVNTVLLAVCIAPAAGCRIPGIYDPVPASLAASRKLSNEGMELLERKQTGKAEEVLAKAVKTCPTDCDARRFYAESLWARDARAEAVAQLEDACGLNPEVELRVRLAEMLLAMGRLEEAGKKAEDALGRNFKLAAAWRVRGQVMHALGDRCLADGNASQARELYLQALSDLHRASGYAAGDRQVLAETAAVYRGLEQPERALETMQGLVETYSPGEEPQIALYWMGRDLLAMRRYDDAATCLSTATLHERPTPELLCRLAEAQYRSGHGQEAATSLQQALVIDPQHVPSRKLLGELTMAQAPQPILRR